MKANLAQFLDRDSSWGDGHNLTARVAEAVVDFMQSGGLTGARSPAQIDYEISGVQDFMNGPLLLFSQPLRRMELSLPAQLSKLPNAPIYDRNHALLALTAFTGSHDHFDDARWSHAER